MFGCTLISLPSSLSDFCSSSAKDFCPASLPTSLPARSQPLQAMCSRVERICLTRSRTALQSKSACGSSSLTSPLAQLDAAEGGRPFTQEYSLVVQSPLGEIYKAATVYAQGCVPCLLSHFPLAPFHCPLTCGAADMSARLVNSRSDSGWEGRGG